MKDLLTDGRTGQGQTTNGLAVDRLSSDGLVRDRPLLVLHYTVVKTDVLKLALDENSFCKMVG